MSGDGTTGSQYVPQKDAAEAFGIADLPEGWGSARLNDGIIADVQPGFACGANNREGEGVPHLRPMNVSSHGKIDLFNLKFVPESKVDTDRRLIHSGDVLFNNTNSPELVGKTACYDLPQPRAFSNHMTRLRCNREAIDSHFCAMALHQKWREGYFLLVCNNHVSQASVSRSVLLETPLALPPLAEQKRIVGKVEALLSRVSGVRARLANVPVLLKRFRQAVLAAACSGRLTADWREEHPQHASGAAFLQGVFGNRRLRYEANNSTRYKKPAPPDESLECEFPDTWAVASMDQLTCLVTSGSRGWAKYYADSGPFFIRAQNINTDQLRLEDIAYVRPPDTAEGRRTQTCFGDLLVTITGANVTKSALVDVKLDEAYVSQHVALVRPVDTSIRNFMHLWTISPSHGRAKLQRDAYGAGKPGLNLDNIREMLIALPSLAEQDEIVRRVEALFNLADAIEQRVAAATARAEKLTQAILAKAFRGELVPTEAELARQQGRSYEPASVLLDRIRADREKTDVTKPKRRTNGRRSKKPQ